MMRPARLEDLAAVQSLTEAAYEPHWALLGGPPLPVTEAYGPRILRGEVWLREGDEVVMALAVFERQADHLLIFSIAVAPGCEGQGLGIELLKFLDGRAVEWGLAGSAALYQFTHGAKHRALSPMDFKKRVADPIPIVQGERSWT